MRGIGRTGQQIAVAACVLVACGSSSPSTETTEKKPAAVADKAKPPDKGELSKREARAVILALNTHVIVMKSGPLAEYRDIATTMLRNPEVIEAVPFSFIEGMLAKDGGASTDVAVKALDPKRNLRSLERYVVRGTLHTLATTAAPPSIVLGDVLADKISARMGDRVQLTLPLDAWDTSEDAGAPRAAVFVVGGIFHTGFDEYDQRMAITQLAAIQQLVGRGDTVLGVEAFVKDPQTSDKVAEEITKELGGPPYQAMDWFELNRAYFITRD